MLIYKDGIVADYREVFKATSFPSTGISDEFLLENNAFKVSAFLPHAAATEKLVACDPYILDGLAYTVKVVAKTTEEIQAELQSKCDTVRAQRNALLAQCDWRIVKSIEQGVPLETEWAAYRQALRDITNNSNFPEVVFPNSPDFVDYQSLKTNS